MGDISSETSMEDILSSIKRIIAEEGDAAVNTPRPRRPRAEPTRHVDAGDESVLDLNAFAAPPPSQQEERPAPMGSARQDTVDDDIILSERAARASSKSLESLSRAVERPEIRGGESVEGLVREMLRPMLREWLDTHLPEMVETMVAREIARITGRES